MKALHIGHTLLISICLATVTQAEEATIKLRTLALQKGDVPQWHIQLGKEKFVKLDWPNTQPSPVIAGMAGEDLQLFVKDAGKEDGGAYKPAIKVAIPEGAEEILLLASSDDEDGKVEVTAFTDKLQTAKFNDWLVINRCERSVSLRFGKGKDPIELEAGAAGIYQVESDPNQSGEVVAEAEIRGEMRKVYSTFWSAASKQRSLVLLYEKDKRIKTRRIIDFLPTKE